MTIDTMIAVGGFVVASASAYSSMKNAKKQNDSADREFTVESIKEIADRQIDSYKVEMQARTEDNERSQKELREARLKLNDTMARLDEANEKLRLNQESIRKMNEKLKSLKKSSDEVKDYYEKQITQLKDENRQLKSRCQYLKAELNRYKKGDINNGLNTTN